MLIKCYIVALTLTIADEIWNINNPRIEAKGKYHIIQWEKKDFYSQKINNEWVLRKYRKTDNNIKRYVRTKYWKKRLKFQK